MIHYRNIFSFTFRLFYVFLQEECGWGRLSSKIFRNNSSRNSLKRYLREICRTSLSNLLSLTCISKFLATKSCLQHLLSLLQINVPVCSSLAYLLYQSCTFHRIEHTLVCVCIALNKNDPAGASYGRNLYKHSDQQNACTGSAQTCLSHILNEPSTSRTDNVK